MILNHIHLMDCIEGMKQIEADTVDLIITSPPYNVGKEYEEVLTLSSYLSWMGKWSRNA